MDRQANVALRAAGPHPAGQGLELLEHELPAPGRAREGGRPAGPLAKEVRARLLDPLGLEHAWYQAVEKPRTELSTGYRLVPGPTGGARAVPVAPASDVMPFRSVVTAAGGAGSIAATAEDTARWMQAFAGGEVLSPAMQTAMLGDVAYTRALHARIPYGLGIQRRVDRRPARRSATPGATSATATWSATCRPTGVTIAVLTNQGVVDPAVVAGAAAEDRPSLGPREASARR